MSKQKTFSQTSVNLGNNCTFTNVNSKKSLVVGEINSQLDIGKEINVLISDFQNTKNMTEIKEKEGDEINNTQKIPNENSNDPQRPSEKNSFIDDLDLGEFNLEDCFRSQMKPKLTNAITGTPHIRSIVKNELTNHNEKREKDYPICTQDQFWNGIDLGKLCENMFTQKRLGSDSGTNNNKINNNNHVQSVNIFQTMPRFEIKRENEIQLTGGNNFSNFALHAHEINSQFSQLNLMKDSFNKFFDYFIAKCQEIDTLKAEVQRLQRIADPKNLNFKQIDKHPSNTTTHGKSSSIERYKNVNENQNCYNKSNIFQPTKTEKPFDIKSVDDQDFDDFLSNLKSNKNKSQLNTNDEMMFMKGVAHFENENDFNVGNFSGNKNLNQFNNQTIQKPNDIINIKEIEDKEFDDLLNNLKQNKKTLATAGNLNPQVGFTNAKSNSSGDNFNFNCNFISTDFMCNNTSVKFNGNNPKVKKLIADLEKDIEPIDDLIDEGTGPAQKKESNKAGGLQKNNDTTKAVVTSNHAKPEIKNNEGGTHKKRTFTDHASSLSSIAKCALDSGPANKKIKKTGFKISCQNKESNLKLKGNQTSIIEENNLTGGEKRNSYPNESKVIILPIAQPSLGIPEFEDKVYSSNTIEECEFMCLCTENLKGTAASDTRYLKKICEVCDNQYKINCANFCKAFYFFFQSDLEFDENASLIKKGEYQVKEKLQLNELLKFFKYQFRFLSWKFYIISKLSNIHSQDQIPYISLFYLKKIMKVLFRKYKSVYIEGKRSFLTRVAEKDSGINRSMILLLFNISKGSTSEYILELSDGYKSIYSSIAMSNPIYSLIEKKIIFPGIKLHIGLAKIDKILDDFSVYIHIFYNSIAKANILSKLGVSPQLKLFMIKNTANLREDGGDISLIDVIVLKKYDYYCYDYSTKLKYSKEKFENMLDEREAGNINEAHLSSQFENNNQDYDEDGMGNAQKITKKTALSEKNNLVKNKILGEAPKKNNEEKNISKCESILFNFKIICVDSLLYFNYLKEVNHSHSNPQVNLSKKLKQKLTRKCVIEFSVKKLNIFEEITAGSRFQFKLLNISGKLNSSVTTASASSHIPSELHLRANDSTLFNEIKFSNNFKKDPIYHKMINELSSSLGVIPIIESTDITDYLSTNNFNFSKILNEEFSFTGIYLNKFIKETAGGIFLFFMNKNNNLILLKIHNESFFDLKKMINGPKSNEQYIIYTFTNAKFQMVYYYDTKIEKLSSFKGERMYEKTFDNNYIVIHLESYYYTNFKMVLPKNQNKKQSIPRIEVDSNKILSNKIAQGQIYEKKLLDDIAKIIC